MKRELSESRVVRDVSRLAAERVTRKVIAHLQKMRIKLSGDDSELKTTWDEVCVQVQDGDSFFRDAYDSTVTAVVAGCVAQLPQYEREAIWLQTEAADEWGEKEPEDRSSYPVCEDEIIEYVAQEYVYSAACNWSNARINAYIDRSNRTD